ncbi:MAG: UvrD-helicase domain-containing protein, partial [Archangium sp.]
ELLDEREASSLLRALLERAVLRRVEAGGAFRELVADIGFERLVAGIAPVAARIREEGVDPALVRVPDAASLRQQFEASLQALKAQARTIMVKPGKQQDALREFQLALARVNFENFEAVLSDLRGAMHNQRAPLDVLREAVSAKGEDPNNISQLYSACLLAPHEAELRELLVEITKVHQDALSARGVLDFTGLLVATRNLLRDDLEARRAAQKRFGALLVDEFQDTNRLQLEIVLLLAEDGAAQVSTAFEDRHEEIVALPQRRGFLAVVGDRKQSIYEFRGADVSVFEVMAQAIERNGGARAYLQHSRRSTAALLERFNDGFAHVMGPKAYAAPPADFEVVYEPEHDDLQAVRESTVDGPAIIELTDATLPAKCEVMEFREHDAEAVARAIVHGVSGAWGVTGGQVALLFQRFTQLEVYRQALVRHGVRHRVVRGRGFYGAQEVIDLASFLTLLMDTDDSLALSVVLRSPLVGLTDTDWVWLARPRAGGKWRLDARALLTDVLDEEGLSAAGVASLRRLRERFAQLRAGVDRLGLRALLRVVLEAFDYRVALAASPFGEQALANLDKLLLLATAREKQGIGVAAFARELLDLADEAPREAEGEVVDELDLEAVTLCTVHQAKGLEWPVVVLPDLLPTPRSDSSAVRFDRAFGLAIVRPSRGDEELKSHSATTITGQLNRRARAEHLRLLYVAMTRARDRVVLGLRPQRAPSRSWAADVEAFFELRVTHGVRAPLETSTLTSTRMATVVEEAQSDVRSLIERVRAPKPLTTRELLVPVTQLQDFVSCPRLFHLAHQIGLAEPKLPMVELEALPEGRSTRERGTAAHRLLELTPLEAVGTSRLRAELESIRRAQGLDGYDVVELVETFWNTPFAREFAARPLRTHRELPFAIRVAGTPDLVLRGQIDLVLERDDELLVIDYKTSLRQADPLLPHRLQLNCYALAASRFFGAAKPIRTAVIFLRDASLEPVFSEPVDLAALTQPLLLATAQLAESQRDARWPGRPRDVCVSLGCGHIGRCHP